MPNGGTHHCGLYCRHFDNETNICNLRHMQIDLPFWTTCKNFNCPDKTVTGPLFAIVCEVKDVAGSYSDIPYFNDRRVDTIQQDGRGDTIVCFTDRDGQQLEFQSVAEYLEYYQRNGSNAMLMRLQISREKARTLGQETFDILQAGYYVTASGARVDIQKPFVPMRVRHFPPNSLV